MNSVLYFALKNHEENEEIYQPAIFSSISKLIISKVSSISNPFELKYLIKLFQIC